MAAEGLTRAELLAELRSGAESADDAPVWPEASWDALCRGGALGWAVPAAHGGTGRDGGELLDGYEALAAACLTTCFILSQRDAACRRLVAGSNDRLAAELLPGLAAGQTFTTVGLSQLTTSRQHGRPALAAKLVDDTLVLDGFMPWVTGAARADFFVTGAVLDDGRQVLAVLPRGLPGVSVGPPLELMALEGSLTGEVRCTGVRLDARWIIAGPAERVMATGRAGPGGLETSALALGLTRAAVEYLEDEATSRPDLGATATRLRQAHRLLRDDVHRAVAGCTPEAAAAVRARANSLVLRATQAALTASKGAGFVRGHPAQRWARQALFFLVWSCPRPAVEATMAYLAPDACSG